MDKKVKKPMVLSDKHKWPKSNMIRKADCGNCQKSEVLYSLNCRREKNYRSALLPKLLLLLMLFLNRYYFNNSLSCLLL